MELADFPNEILDMILYHLDSHTDLYALMRTCRTLYNTCSNTGLAFHADFKSWSGKYLLQQQHPGFITAITTELGDWAIESNDHKFKLKAAMKKGLGSVLNLAARVGWVRLDEIRTAHTAPNEIETFLDKLYAINYRPMKISSQNLQLTFDTTHDQYSNLNHQDPVPRYGDEAANELLFFIVYCALFRPEINITKNFCEERRSQLNAQGRIRRHFMRYCAPACRDYHGIPNFVRMMTVRLPVPFNIGMLPETRIWEMREDALIRFWKNGKLTSGDVERFAFSGDWPDDSEDFFVRACELQGWPSLLMLLPGNERICIDLLQDIRFRMMKAMEGVLPYEHVSWPYSPDFFNELDRRQKMDRRVHRHVRGEGYQFR